jgi:hypothetical protein
MAVTPYLGGLALINALGGDSAGEAPNIDWLSDTIKVALFTDAHAPDQDVDEFYDGAHGLTEVSSGGGYTTGGATLASKTIGYTAGTNVIKLDAADTQWAAATFTARYAMVYDDTPASNKPIIGWLDFGANQSPANQTFIITWDATGIATLTVA